MRYLVAGLSILLAMLLLCELNLQFVRNNFNELLDFLVEIEGCVRSDEWRRAAELADECEEKWNKNEKYYLSVLFHDHVDDYVSTFYQLQSNIVEESYLDAISSIVTARSLLVNIIEMESLRLGNIL